VVLTCSADDLVRLTIGRVSAPHLAWAEGERVALPRDLLDACGLLRRITPDRTLDIPAGISAPTAPAARLREQAAFTPNPPALSRLPVSYQVVPGWARALIGHAVGRWRRRAMPQWARFPGFPLDLSADVASDLARPHARVAGRTPVVLSHDIDSPEGLRNLIERFLPIEEGAAAQSVNFIVPCAWPIDEGLVREAQARGHEIGVHGFDHSNRTPFSDDRERHHRIDGARGFAERYAARGYRAPSLLRTRALLRDLGRLYAYDSSIPTSGGLFPVPNNGCATARPFRVEGITELPVSMPRDGSLRFLGYAPSSIGHVWRECASRIATSGGVVVLLTHCERRFSGAPSMLDVYRRFVEFVAESDRFEFRRADDLAPLSQEVA
jgi:peptidoglycan/xylan/chitin deacetylase (PgdA/CDA1 family)